MDTVAASTVKVAEPISSNLDGVASKTVPRRRIIAEDPEWNMAPVEKLSNICVKLIVSNFESSVSLM